MSWSRLMLAIPSLGEIAPIKMGKILKLAASLGAQLEIFHCIYDGQVARPGRFGTRGAHEDIREFIEQRRQQLEITAARMRGRGIRVCTSVCWDYPTHEGIVRQVLRHKPDLLIAGTTGEGQPGHLHLSRTDFRLIETCPCPILFMKTQRPYSDVVIAAAVDPKLTHEKPAALDHEILESACNVRDALCGRLLLFHAGAAQEAVKQTEKETDPQLLALAGRYGIPRQRVHVLPGPPAEALSRFADRQIPDIIVMGAIARSRLRRALIGHTAERVLDSLDCDLLIVKPPGFQTPVSHQSTHHVKIGALSA